MHIKAICTVLPFLILSLAAPIDSDFRRSLLVARTAPLLKTTNLAQLLTSHSPAPALTAKPASRFNELKLASTPQKASTCPLPSSLVYSQKNSQRSSVRCHSRSPGSEDSGSIQASGTHKGYVTNHGEDVSLGKEATHSSHLIQLKASANPKDWPSGSRLKHILKTDDHQATFWSGWSGPKSSQAEAVKDARARGGTTLEMLLHQGGAKMPILTPGDKMAGQQWVKAAKIYALHAKGDVNAHLGETIRPGNIYEGVEKPILLQNKHVTSITEHKHDGSKTIIRKVPSGGLWTSNQ